MPQVTRDDVAFGFIELKVVLALMSATKPGSAIANATRMSTRVVTSLINKGKSSNGQTFAIFHIATPTSNATIGGGILSSKAFMKLDMILLLVMSPAGGGKGVDVFDMDVILIS
jgi:hypothetical protein